MRRAVLSALVTMLLASACGASTTPTPATAAKRATLVLDFAPNAVHAGIYTALVRRYDRAAGVRLEVIAPSASTDAIKLLQSGRVQFAILDIHDLAIAAARGAQLVGVMAIVERPLAAVIASPAVHNPRQLQGRTVGVTGVPSDGAVLRSIVAGAGGDPARVHTITIGYDAVADLLAGRVAAATSFWNDEGVTLQRRRPGFHVFRLESYGAPAYPELVLGTTTAIRREQPALVGAVTTALTAGYRAVLADPRAGAAALERLVPGLDPSLVSAELSALRPTFEGPDGQPGELDQSALRAWAAWERSFGLVPRTPDVSRLFSH
ncbi:MAG: ABC transporter substrate-binding protein [Solirubrobacterales bacterium]|nr:ABC transporter substrate-binding protein [Solirubrobacterales bacterium]